MRIFRLLVAGGLVLAASGCADFYYRAIGRGGWPHEQNLLYTRLGGEAGVKKVVDDWVQAAAADPRISRYFARADLPQLKFFLTQLVCTNTGGPCVYTGRGMIDSHTGVNVSDSAFDAFMDALQQSLNINGVPPHAQKRLFNVLRPMRDHIVTVSG